MPRIVESTLKFTIRGNRGFALANDKGLPYSLTDMNFNQNCVFLTGIIALFALCSITGCSSTTLPYERVREGNYHYINPFSYKPEAPQEHWEYASSLEAAGKTKRAREEFEILVKRWPDSAEAISAKQKVADLYFAEGKNSSAFETYEELINEYYTDIQDYEAILNRLFAIAEKEMTRRRMKWLFGGYTAPEQAIPYFESILKNAPQWERAPEIQYTIGQAYEKGKQLSLAVAAYSTVEYRYPDSPYAEKAAYAKIGVLKKLVQSTPYSMDLLEQAETAVKLYQELYPDSEHIAEIQSIADDFRERAAQHEYETGKFYERIPRPAKSASADIYYKKAVEEYEGTKAADEAAERLSALNAKEEEPQPPPQVASRQPPEKNAEIQLQNTSDETGGGSGSQAVAIRPAEENAKLQSMPADNGIPIEAAPSGAVLLPERAVNMAEAVEFTADRLDYSAGLLTGAGHAAFRQQAAALQADHMTVDPQNGEIHARGNVLMDRDGEHWAGRELDYNYRSREGTFDQWAMYFEPAYLVAGKAERVSTNEFLIHDVMLASRSAERLPVCARASRVRIIDSNEPAGALIVAENMTFYIGPVPVFYTPVWQRHLGYRTLSFTIGSTGNFGAFVTGSAEMHPGERLASSAYLDLYSQRGTGTGRNFKWSAPNGESERNPAAAPARGISVPWRDQVRLTAPLDRLSDPDAFNDFFSADHRAENAPGTRPGAAHSAEKHVFGLNADHRLNDFYAAAGQKPGHTAEHDRRQIGTTPFYFTSGKDTGLPEESAADESEAIEITADQMESAGGLLIGEGHVTFKQQGTDLQADHVTVDPKTGEINASGNILMIRDGDRWEGQELTYNYKTRKGTFGQSTMYFDPAYITARKTERVSTNEFLMNDVLITTCSGENPIVYAKAKEMRVIDENKPSGTFIKAKDVTFYVGPVPVFYTPVWQRHLGYRVFSIVLGTGGGLGYFAKIGAELHPTDWLSTKTHLDLYSKRGVGLGQDLRWITPHGKGKIETYYIHDSDPTKDRDDPARRRLVDSDRYRIKVQHREQMDDKTYFSTKLNWLSDPDVTDDFFKDEFRHEANPENYAVLQHSADDYAVGLRVDQRLNDFYTTVNRRPQLSFDSYRRQLGETPFHFESENNVGFFEEVNAETNLPPVLRGDNYRSARLDTYNRLFLPLRFNDFLNVIPRAGYRGTWYSKTDTDSEDAKYRHIFELGTLSSFKAYKTLTEQSGFYGTGLRHVFEPYVDYNYRYSSAETNKLYQFDAIDKLNDQNEVRFGSRNFLQTKRGAKRIANFLDSDVYTSYRFDPQSDEEDFGPLVADAEMSLTDHFYIQGDTEYDWYTHELNPANARLRLVTDDESEYAVSYRFRDDDEADRSLFTASAQLFPNARWSYEFMVRYDEKRDEWEERRAVVTHKFNCIGMGIGYRSDEDDEQQIWIQLWLTAFPQTFINF
ncbi:MAG: LPS-assembly protein [Verrucomicrobiota bacterium]|nr:LPS-assembly protein [Verrucomicrobiota bacterium]